MFDYSSLLGWIETYISYHEPKTISEIEKFIENSNIKNIRWISMLYRINGHLIPTKYSNSLIKDDEPLKKELEHIQLSLSLNGMNFNSDIPNRTFSISVAILAISQDNAKYNYILNFWEECAKNQDFIYHKNEIKKYKETLTKWIEKTRIK